MSNDGRDAVRAGRRSERAQRPQAKASRSPPIALHGARTGNCLRVSVTLGELAIPYEVVRVDLRGGEQRGEPHMKINPAGKVPTIVEQASDGSQFVLSQSNAIMMYLADKTPGNLLPMEPHRRALALERLLYFVTDVIAVNHAAFALRGGGGDGAFLEARSLAALEFAEKFLAQTEFVAGDRFSLADISAFTITAACEKQIDWGNLPRLRAWYRAVGSRPAVRLGMQAFDGPAP